MEISFTSHARYRLSRRYQLNVGDIKHLRLERLGEESYWLVINKEIDALAVIKDGKVITMLSMWHNLSQKIFERSV